MQWELARKAKNIPWINQCPAAISSEEKIFGLAEGVNRPFERIFITTTSKPLGDNNTTCDPRKHSCTCCRHKTHQTLSCIYSPKTGKNRCQSYTPNLPCASVCKKHINVSSHAAKWLLQALGLFFKAMAMLVRKSSYQPTIKVIPVRSNPRKKVCESQARLDSTRPTTGKPGSHQHDTCQHSCGFLL